jgi:hypothetical protein
LEGFYVAQFVASQEKRHRCLVWKKISDRAESRVTPASQAPTLSRQAQMDGPLKELSKLEKLTSGPLKGKVSISDSLDSLLQSLREAKDAIQPGTVSPDLLLQLSQTVDVKKKEVDERQKEVYNSVSRLGKALDKVRTQHSGVGRI